MAYFVQVAPPLIFSLWAGAAADRLNRRMIAIVLNVARAVVLGFLAATIVTGSVNIALVLGALFLLATAETFADIAEGSLLPRIVPREHLTTANARMSGAFLGDQPADRAADRGVPVRRRRGDPVRGRRRVLRLRRPADQPAGPRRGRAPA